MGTGESYSLSMWKMIFIFVICLIITMTLANKSCTNDTVTKYSSLQGRALEFKVCQDNSSDKQDILCHDIFRDQAEATK